ncbi:MAG TPA: hypothetical protein VI818_04855, partial [Candidatus Thermoplasmatota archaeon]|nr:hypothetical protein [Candidatus Thermoplasmatota archaeon]
MDAQFGGGIPSGTSILLLADPSNAPYLFNEQFAAGGLEKGERVYFYSLERPKEEILTNLRAYMTRDPGPSLQFFDCYSVKMKALPPAAMKKLGITNHAVNVTEDIIERLVGDKHTAPFRVVIESVSEAVHAYGLEPTLNMLR